MRTGRSSCVLRTHASSHSTSVGHTRAHMPPMMFSLEDGVGRALEVAAADLLDEAGNVDAGRAGGRAGGGVAEVAAVGVDDRLGRRQRRMHVRKVGRDLLVAETSRTQAIGDRLVAAH